jgi:hypothetical protein
MSRTESPDLQLLELLRRSDAPSDVDMRRVRDAIDIKLAVGVGASTALLAATHSSWWAMRLGSLGAWAKGLLLVSSLAGVGVGVTWYMKPKTSMLGAPRWVEPPVAQPPAQRGAAPANPRPEPAKAESQVQEPGLSEREQKARGTPSKGAGRAVSSTLEAELEILGRAQRALKSGQPNEALRALDEHARRFPSGVLTLERSGVRTVALCQAGRLEEGRAAARSYLRVVTNSVLSKRIRIACQLPDE